MRMRCLADSNLSLTWFVDMATFPCPDFLRDCECENFPVRNFTQEEPDVPVFIGTFNNPPTTGTYFAPGCLAICESTVSQADADECAELQAEQCSIDNTPAVGNPVPTNRSTMQFTTASPLDAVCVDDVVLVAFNVIGGTAPYTFTQVSGDLPDGTTLDAGGTLSGTATTGGTFSFAVRATDSIGRTKTKSFSMSVIEITSPETLPGGTLNTAYSYTLLSVGASSPVWTVDSGTLPPGLSVSAAGVISGTPTDTEPENYIFTLKLTNDGSTECLKQFIIFVNTLVGYWAFEEYDAPEWLDSTINHVDLDDGFNGGQVPGVVGNAFAFQSTTAAENISNPPSWLNLNDQGITICGWLRVDFTASDSRANIFQAIWSNVGPGSTEFFFEYDGLGSFRLEMDGPNPLFAEVFAPAIDDLAWHFYRAWYDPSDNRVRLQIDNGTIHVSVDTIAVPDTDSVTRFGLGGPITSSGPNNTRFFDETGVWMRVLTNDEADAVYNNGNGITFGNPNMPK